MARGRKRTPCGRGRRANQYSRECESYTKKLAVIDFLKYNNMQETLDKFYSHLISSKRESKRKRIYEWEKSRAHIEAMVACSATANLKSARKKGTATTLSPTAEEGLVEWVNSMRGEGVPVSRLMLQLQALQIAKDIGVPDGIFEGRWSWQQGFLSRHGLSLRAKTRQGQKSPAAMEEAAQAFWQEVEDTKRELGVNKVYNADQSGILFEYLPKQTISKKGAKTVWVRCGGKDKERFTGMFLADSTGKQYDTFYVVKTEPSKIPEKAAYNYIAQHGFGDKLWPAMKDAQTQLGVQIYGNSSAWWNSDLSVPFLDYHFASRDEAEPILLHWDDFSAHWTDEVKKHATLLNVHLLKVPPGLTSVCQPADISWFRPLKQRLRRQWVNFLSQQLNDYSAGGSHGKFELQPPSRREAVTWATTAWKLLGEVVIKSGFNPHTKRAMTEFAENDVIEQMESLQLIDDAVTVCDDDDVVEHCLDASDGNPSSIN